MKKIIYLLSLAALLWSCNNKPALDENDNVLCTCPPLTIWLTPFDDFSDAETQLVQKDLLVYFKSTQNLNEAIEIAQRRKLTPDLMNDTKTRYRADKIVKYLQKDADEHNIYIGLTHKDISLPYKQHADWGVQGLSLIPGDACVVSTFRVKNRKQLWKTVLHEYIHTRYDYSHCPNDDPKCIMEDANGKPNFTNKWDLCEYCKSQTLAKDKATL